MMKPLRLVLVTRRFWPLVGGAERVMSNLATEFQQLGADVTIVTAQWEKDWPTAFMHRDVPVVRLPNPRRRGLGTFRYMRALSRWLRDHHDAIDAVLVSMLKHDAYVAVGEMRRAAVPVVLRAEGGGKTGDCQWQQTGRFGGRIQNRCVSADAVIAPSEAIEAELLAAGYPRDRVHFVSNGVPIPEARTAANQAAARAALGETHTILSVAPQAPLVVYTGRLQREKGLGELVEAWPTVSRRWPKARLWLIGEGPFGERLWNKIKDRQMTDQVILPGSFDEVVDVLHAADVFVLPSYEEGMSLSLLEAMAAGLPAVASDIPGNRKLIVDGQHGLLVPTMNATGLAEAIVRLIGDSSLSTRLAANARRRVEVEYSLRRMAETHLEIFGKVHARRSP